MEVKHPDGSRVYPGPYKSIYVRKRISEMGETCGWLHVPLSPHEIQKQNRSDSEVGLGLIIYAVMAVIYLITAGIIGTNNSTKSNSIHKEVKEELTCIEQKTRKCVEATANEKEKAGCVQENLVDRQILSYYLASETNYRYPLAPWEREMGEYTYCLFDSKEEVKRFENEFGLPVQPFEEFGRCWYKYEDAKTRVRVCGCIHLTLGDMFLESELPKAPLRCRNREEVGSSSYKEFLKRMPKAPRKQQEPKKMQMQDIITRPRIKR